MHRTWKNKNFEECYNPYNSNGNSGGSASSGYLHVIHPFSERTEVRQKKRGLLLYTTTPSLFIHTHVHRKRVKTKVQALLACTEIDAEEHGRVTKKKIES